MFCACQIIQLFSDVFCVASAVHRLDCRLIINETPNGDQCKEDRKVEVKFNLEQTTSAQRYSATLSLTSVLDGGGWSTPRPGRFTPRKPDTHCIVGCVGPKAGLERCGKSHPHRYLIPVPSNP